MLPVSRILNLRPIVEAKSCFLLGPRQTGKTSLLRAQFPHALFVDLLDEALYLRLQTRPTELRELIPETKKGVVVIDEIQRVPALLNEIHSLIERHKSLRFVMTGSSARKLRKGGVNLLGGRARSRRMHPFAWTEIKDRFDLSQTLLHGALPPIVFSDSPREDLKSYVGDYLREEIAAEAVTRNLPAFSRFLETAAHSNGRALNYENVANDAQVKRSTVQNYFDVLRETLVGTDLEPFRKTRSRKAVATAKFFFFDLGVVNFLKRVRELPERTPLFGEAFEAWIHHELRTWVDYRGDGELQYWRSLDGRFEVDFILNEEIAIECKATRSASHEDLRGLRALRENFRFKRSYLVCMEPEPRRVDGIDILPWKRFMERLWGNTLHAR